MHSRCLEILFHVLPYNIIILSHRSKKYICEKHKETNTKVHLGLRAGCGGGGGGGHLRVSKNLKDCQYRRLLGEGGGRRNMVLVWWAWTKGKESWESLGGKKEGE